MDGWRDAHYDQAKADKSAKDDAAREDEETRERHETIWKEAGVTEDLERDPLSLDDHGEGSSRTGAGSSSVSGSAYPMFNNNNNNNSNTNGSASRNTGKGKVKAPQPEYNASTAMRLAISDDEDESNDYEVALDRMRKSMNLGQESDRRKSLPTKKEEASRKNEIDLDDYDSDVADEDDEDEPLFTHRALQMMGDLNAVQKQSASSIAKLSSAQGSGVVAEAHEGVEAMDEDEDTEHIAEESVPAPTITSSASPPQEDGHGHDDENTFARRKPARRAIIMDDSDDE